jgi:hypothetical protein
MAFHTPTSDLLGMVDGKFEGIYEDLAFLLAPRARKAAEDVESAIHDRIARILHGKGKPIMTANWLELLAKHGGSEELMDYLKKGKKHGAEDIFVLNLSEKDIDIVDETLATADNSDFGKFSACCKVLKSLSNELDGIHDAVIDVSTSAAARDGHVST